MKLKKISAILILSIFSVFVLADFVLAQFTPEVTYPEIASKTVTTTTSLPEYIIYMFNLAVIIGVLIVIGVVVFGGFLYLTSAGNPSQMREAKSRIFNGFLGLIILLASYLILNTINPQLTVIRLESVEIKRGIALIDGNEKEYLGVDVKNIQARFGENFQPTKIEFISESLGAIKVVAYSEPDFKGNSQTFTNDGDTSWPIRSVKLIGIGPGIYLSNKDPNSPSAEKIYLTSNIPHLGDFNDKAKYIEFKDYFSNNTPQTHFLAVLHSDAYYKGGLRLFFEERDNGNVTNTTPVATSYKLVEGNDAYGEIRGGRGLPTSAQIFQLGPPENCKEIRLYKRTNFAGEPQREGEPVDPNEVCVLKLNDPSHPIPIYTPKNIEDSSVCGGGWSDKIRSIKIDPQGKCLVVLFGQWENGAPNAGFPDGAHNEVFTHSDPDLTDNSIGQCRPGGIIWWSPRPCASAIAVYPLK